MDKSDRITSVTTNKPFINHKVLHVRNIVSSWKHANELFKEII